MQKGEKMSAEQKAKISATKKGKKYGPQSAEHRARMSASVRAALAAKKARELPEAYPGENEYRRYKREQMRQLRAAGAKY